jgi:hypothetical protein
MIFQLHKWAGSGNVRSSVVVVTILAGAVAFSTGVAAQDGQIDAQLLEQEDFEPGLEQARLPQTGAVRLDQRFDLNGVSLAFEVGSYLDLNLSTSEAEDLVLDGGVGFVREVETEQGLDLSAGGQRGNIRQSAWVFQLNTMDSHRTVTQRLDERGELIGFRLGLSLTGRCILPGAPVDGYCTYTPGISTDPSLIDPDTLVPAAFVFNSEFGQEIPEAVHRSLFATGFQRGADVLGGPLVGVDLDVLNAGFAAFPDSPLSGSRHEDTQRRFVPTAAFIEQTLSTNSVEAAATRTTRAIVLPASDEIDGVYLTMQLASLLLPSVNETVGYVDRTPNASVSNNLFNALSNARVPAGSYTIFETGRADIVHSITPPESAAQTPVARYNGVWMGMSPVRNVRTTQRLQFIQNGDRISVNDPAFEEGGFGPPFSDLVDAGITLVDEFDQSITSLNLQNVDDLYVQLGLDLTRQDAIRQFTATERTDYRLVPHLSFSGNRTGGETVLRYYTGFIFSEDVNAYVGADFTLATESGWSAYGRLDLYSEPELDYRSEVEMRGGRTFRISPDRQIAVGAGAIIGLDNEMFSNRIGFPEDETQADIFGRWQEGDFSFTVNENFTRDGGGDWGQATTLGVGYSPNDRFSVSAQLTPWSTVSSYLEGAIGVNYRMDGLAGSPVLQAQFSRAKYLVGSSSLGETTSVDVNKFSAGLQMRF